MNGSILLVLLNWLGGKGNIFPFVLSLFLWSKANMPVLTWVVQCSRVSNIFLAVM